MTDTPEHPNLWPGEDDLSAATGTGDEATNEAVDGGTGGGGEGAGDLDGGGPAAMGGRVRRGGLVALRQGELVVPFEGSQAEVVLAEQDGRHDIHVHLPVTVEIVGGPDPQHVRAAVDDALRRVRHAIDAHEAWG